MTGLKYYWSVACLPLTGDEIRIHLRVDTKTKKAKQRVSWTIPIHSETDGQLAFLAKPTGHHTSLDPETPEYSGLSQALGGS